MRRLFSRLAKTVAGEGLEKETEYLKEFRGPHTKYQVSNHNHKTNCDRPQKGQANVAWMKINLILE